MVAQSHHAVDSPYCKMASSLLNHGFTLSTNKGKLIGRDNLLTSSNGFNILVSNDRGRFLRHLFPRLRLRLVAIVAYSPDSDDCYGPKPRELRVFVYGEQYLQAIGEAARRMATHAKLELHEVKVCLVDPTPWPAGFYRMSYCPV